MTDPNAYTVEIAQPDISPYGKGNTGIEYATTIDSGEPGPHVMLTALAHGNGGTLSSQSTAILGTYETL